MNIEELKQAIDLDDLALKLGLERKGNSGNYKSPHHGDKSPSISIFNNGKSFNDFSSQEPGAGGSCIDFILYIEDLPDVAAAVNRLHEIYGFEKDRPVHERKEKKRDTLPEYIAKQAVVSAESCIPYLSKERLIREPVLQNAINDKTLGYHDYRSKKFKEGDNGHGGPAVTFICRDLQSNVVRAVDLRYIDPTINGGGKTRCQGEKTGLLWVSDRNRLKRAHTVYIVESPINALTVDDCSKFGTTAVAFRGVNTSDINWHFLRGKTVRILVDNDDPDDKGYRPGPAAGWRIHEELIAINIPCLFVDQFTGENWIDINDINDYLKAYGHEETSHALRRLEACLIQNMPYGDERFYNRRVYLPGHDYAVYWRYRVKEDFTSMVKNVTDDDGNSKETFDDIAGFRIAALSRIRISSTTAMMTGVEDTQPRTLFSASVQTPRHENQLIRRVLTDENLHNIDQWKKFGPVFKAGNFARMLNILERSVDIGARHAINFVGVAWKDGKAVVNEGEDCYFTDPDKQCTYSNLRFPSAPVSNAATVIRGYQQTFGDNAASIMLAWSLGTHLKNFLGFWPHLILQARKGAGKTTLCKRLETTIGMTMMSGQSLKTEYRILTSLSCTSHPIGWEEISARRQDVIDQAVSLLQESYNYNLTRRGSDMTEYVVSAPVLLAGEDVPVQSLLGKVVRTQLETKGSLLPDDTPVFPVREWLEYLCQLPRHNIVQRFRKAEQYFLKLARATGSDTDNNNGVRMASNYSAIMFAWTLLCDFAGIDRNEGDFFNDCIRQMNSHIADTSTDREPWIWIMERILNDIDAKNYLYPYRIDESSLEEEGPVIYLRASHIMQHLQHPTNMNFFNSLPIKRPQILKKQLMDSGVVVNAEAECSTGNRRVGHMLKMSVEKLAQWGLFVSLQSNTES